LKIDLINLVDFKVSSHVVIHVSSSKREIIFWFLAAMISFSSSNKILREEKRESIEVTGRGCMFFVCNL